MFLKENVHPAEDTVDVEDMSVMRTEESFLKIFKYAGMEVVDSYEVVGMLADMYPVRQYVLRKLQPEGGPKKRR